MAVVDMHIEAVVKLPFQSGLPRDVSINTFHFAVAVVDDDPVDDMFDGIRNVIELFYNSAGPNFAIAHYLSGVINRPACKISLFSWTGLDSGPALLESTFTLGGAAGGSHNYPNEVSAVLSLLGAPDELSPLLRPARRRGRVYLGPLNDAVSAEGAGVIEGRILDEFREDCVDAAGQLAGVHTFGDNSSSYVWSVFSRGGTSKAWLDPLGHPTDVNTGVANPNFYAHTGIRMSPIHGAYMDDDFDVQRRRSVGPSTRTSATF